MVLTHPVRCGRSGRCFVAARLAPILLALAASNLEAQTRRWERSVQLSTNAWYGAAHARVVATELGVSRTDSTVTVRSDLQLGYADDRDENESWRVTARAMRASLALDYRPFARYSPFGFGSIESSLQARIARRYNVGLGAKLTLRRKGQDDLSVSLALLEERTRALTSGESIGDLTGRRRWSFRFRYRRQLTPSLYASQVTFYQPAVGAVTDRYIVDANTSVEATLTSILSLTGTLRHRYDSEARGRGAASNTDGHLLIGARARF
jgi:hypothetical protein